MLIIVEGEEGEREGNNIATINITRPLSSS